MNVHTQNKHVIHLQVSDILGHISFVKHLLH